MLPVVLLLAAWFAVNVGVMVASVARSAPRRRRPAPDGQAVRRRTPVDARTSTVWTYSHTL